MKRIVTNLFFLMGFLFFSGSAFSQSTPLSLKVQAAKEAKSNFTKIAPFEFAGDLSLLKGAEEALHAGQVLNIDSKKLGQILF